MMPFSPHDHQFSSLGWLLEDPISIISHEQENFNYLCSLKSETSDLSINDHLHFPSSNNIHHKNGESTSFDQNEFRNIGDEDKVAIKKMNHNTIERNRRQRINSLYSTLRSLLPPHDQSRKMSIPTTVSRVLKYIPELKKEIERLSKKKESLILSKINSSRVENHDYSSFGLNNMYKRIKPIQTSLSSAAVSATPVSDREIVFQISLSKAEKPYSLSEAVTRLEQEGYLAINATCFESFDGRVFYNLHLQAQGSQVLMDAEMLKEKVWPF